MVKLPLSYKKESSNIIFREIKALVILEDEIEEEKNEKKNFMDFEKNHPKFNTKRIRSNYKELLDKEQKTLGNLKTKEKWEKNGSTPEFSSSYSKKNEVNEDKLNLEISIKKKQSKKSSENFNSQQIRKNFYPIKREKEEDSKIPPKKRKNSYSFKTNFHPKRSLNLLSIRSDSPEKNQKNAIWRKIKEENLKSQKEKIAELRLKTQPQSQKKKYIIAEKKKIEKKNFVHSFNFSKKEKKRISFEPTTSDKKLTPLNFKGNIFSTYTKKFEQENDNINNSKVDTIPSKKKFKTKIEKFLLEKNTEKIVKKMKIKKSSYDFTNKRKNKSYSNMNLRKLLSNRTSKNSFTHYKRKAKEEKMKNSFTEKNNFSNSKLVHSSNTDRINVSSGNGDGFSSLKKDSPGYGRIRLKGYLRQAIGKGRVRW